MVTGQHHDTLPILLSENINFVALFFTNKHRGHHDLGAKHIEELGCEDVALRFPGFDIHELWL